VERVTRGPFLHSPLGAKLSPSSGKIKKLTDGRLLLLGDAELRPVDLDRVVRAVISGGKAFHDKGDGTKS
jgi:hypothetical protein